MKILITAPSLEEQQNVSGISTVVRQIIENSRHEFSHFAAGRRDGQRIVSPGWVFRQLNLVPHLRGRIRREEPDLLHLNTALTRLAIGRDLVLAGAARSLEVPVLLHIHGGKYFTGGLKNPISRIMTKKMLDRADLAIVLSETEKEFIRRCRPGLDIRVLPNAVAVNQSAVRKNRDDAPATIVFLGRMHDGKGLAEIVRACRILKADGCGFDFRCYGAGERKDEFVRQMTGILGARFSYGGVVSAEEKSRALAEADVFLLPSHYEGLPLALLEAMAAGCIPVVSDVGSLGQIIREAENGFLVEPRNFRQLAEKIRWLLAADATVREKLRQNARRTVRENFDLQDYIAKLEAIYAEFAGPASTERD